MTEEGFSTLELMIAFAVLAIVFSGVVFASFGAQYWSVVLDTSHEALFSASQNSAEVRALARHDFLSATSSFASSAEDDCGSALCYYSERNVKDISPCSKEAQVSVRWRVAGYPTSTTAIDTSLTHVPAILALGGDCARASLEGEWTSLHEIESMTLPGTPVGVDSVNGTTYVIEQTPSAIRIIDGTNTGIYTPPDNATFNAIDVARDFFTGRTYAYLAATSTQLRVVDVTDASSPVLAASITLSGVPAGVEAGWRLQYYDRRIYIVTRFLSSPSSRELHILDVADPASPQEIGNYKLNTSAYAILVRDQYVGEELRRLAYFGATHTGKELIVLDVTDPHNIVQKALCDLPNVQRATALFMLGNTLYVGRENVPSGGEDLYAFNATDPTRPTFCTPIAKTDINDDGFSRHVQAIRGSGGYLFVETNNTTNAHGNIQIRVSDTKENLKLLGVYSIANLPENGIDLDSDANTLYAVDAGGSPSFHVLTSHE